MRGAPIGSGLRRGGSIALAAVGAALPALVSCSRDPDIEERRVIVYSPRACPVSQANGFAAMYASGDFEPSETNPAVAALYLRDVGAEMRDFPPLTRAVSVNVIDHNAEWLGLSEVPPTGPINVLVWPTTEACRLTRNVERRSEFAFGVFGDRFLVAGGRRLDGSQTLQTFVGDLTTGAVESLKFGLNTPRARATITPFTVVDPDGTRITGALVAGGEDPDPDRRNPLRTAEVYLPKRTGEVGDFEKLKIELSEERSQHGAVTLATGETLLVGGQGTGGLLRTLEIVDPLTRQSKTGGLDTLIIPRTRPTVLRLPSGEVMVAGGFDARGTSVDTIEFFTPDARRHSKPISPVIAPGRERAFAPLEGGGALVVIRPGDTPVNTVSVISADGNPEPVDNPLDPAELEVVRLFPGTGGRPVLWTGKRWLRWEPWFAVFEAIPDAPAGAGPSSEGIANGDPGLAMWLEDRDEAGMYVTAWRHSRRTRFDSVPKPLLVDNSDHLAPDRRPSAPGGSIWFDPAQGLMLGTGASAFVTDVTFADFDLDVEVTAGAPTVVLRQSGEAGLDPAIGREIEIGGIACAFAQSARSALHVARRDKTLRVRVDDFDERVCPGEVDEGARVAIGLRGSSGFGVSGAKNLRILRR